METKLVMILCDTNIFINAFNGNSDTISLLKKIGFDNIVLSSITVMELLQGMGNKTELLQMRRKIKYYDIELFTYNLKDFQFMPNIRLYKE